MLKDKEIAQDFEARELLELHSDRVVWLSRAAPCVLL